MTDTATPSLATQVAPWRRRLLATALIVGAGTAVGAGATGLTADGGHRGGPPAVDAKDHPNYGPVDTWTGDTKDHPNYGPVDTWTGDTKDHPNYGPVDTWTGDAKDHPNYGPVDTWTGDTKDHPNYGPVDTWTGDTKDHPNYGPVTAASQPPRGG